MGIKPDNAIALSPLFEVIRDSSTYGITRIISVLLGLVAIPVFAQILTPDMLGRYYIALLTVTISSQVVNEWSRSSVLRFDTRYRNTDQYDTYLSNVFIFPLLFGILVGLVALFLLHATGIFSGFREYVLVCIAVFVVSILDALLITLLRVRQQARRFSIILLAKRFIALSTGVGLILSLRTGGEGLIYGMLISLAVSIPLSIRWTAISRSISISNISMSHLKRYLSYGIPLTFFALSAFLLRYTDRYMISYFKDMDQVGLYSFASLLPQRTIETLIGIVALGAFPVIVKEWEQTSSESATGITSSLARYHMLLTIPIATIMLLFPKELLSLAGSAQYTAAYPAIPLLALGSYFSSTAWFSSIAFSLSTRTSLLLLITFFSVLINVVINLFTIPEWGFKGAALSTMITSFLYFSGVFFISRKWLPWRIKGQAVLRIVSAAIVSGGLTLIAKTAIGGRGPFRTIGVVLLFIVLYATMLQLLGELRLRKLASVTLAILRRNREGPSDD